MIVKEMMLSMMMMTTLLLLMMMMTLMRVVVSIRFTHDFSGIIFHLSSLLFASHDIRHDEEMGKKCEKCLCGDGWVRGR